MHLKQAATLLPKHAIRCTETIVALRINSLHHAAALAESGSLFLYDLMKPPKQGDEVHPMLLSKNISAGKETFRVMFDFMCLHHWISLCLHHWAPCACIIGFHVLVSFGSMCLHHWILCVVSFNFTVSWFPSGQQLLVGEMQGQIKVLNLDGKVETTLASPKGEDGSPGNSVERLFFSHARLHQLSLHIAFPTRMFLLGIRRTKARLKSMRWTLRIRYVAVAKNWLAHLNRRTLLSFNLMEFAMSTQNVKCVWSLHLLENGIMTSSECRPDFYRGDLDHFVILGFKASNDVALLVYNSVGDGWELLDLDPECRIELPVPADEMDSGCFGLAVDLTSTDKIPAANPDDPSYPACPIVRVLTDDGKLLSYHFEYRSSGVSYPLMKKKVEKLDVGSKAETITSTLILGESRKPPTSPKKDDALPAAAPPPSFSFTGATKEAPKSSPTATTAAAKFGFGAPAESTQKPAFSFGAPTESTPKPAFSFAAPTESTQKPAFSFAAPAVETPKSAFSFAPSSDSTSKSFAPSGDSAAKPTLSFGVSTDSTAAKPLSFGGSAFSASVSTSKPVFSLQPADAPKAAALIVAQTSATTKQNEPPAPVKQVTTDDLKGSQVVRNHLSVRY